MKLTTAIDEFIADKRSEGRINSDRTEAGYRRTLEAHATDVGNRDPSKIGREDVKRTLRRWPHPNTQANARAILVSFYRWTLQEGIRKDNPAEQTRPPRRRKPAIYRLTRAEVIRLMRACQTRRERRVIYIGLLTGARNQEMRGLQRRHFERQGAVWISPDIGKGGRERFIPVLPELEAIVAEILEHTEPGDYIIPTRRSLGGRRPGAYRELPKQPCATQTVIDIVVAVGERAGIQARIHPHLLRHAFGDHVTRQAGLRAAQEVLGHADVSTTETTYTGRVTLDELTAALAWFRYDGYPTDNTPEKPGAASSRTLPAEAASRDAAKPQRAARRRQGGSDADAADGDPRRSP